MESNFLRRAGIACAAAFLLAGYAVAASGQKPTPAITPLFERKIRPLLLASCVGCHGKDGPQGGLRLDAAISPEKAQEVMRRVKGEGGKPRMPLGGTLAADKIAALEEWVKQGAPWPSTGAISAPNPMTRGKNHWAFQPLKRPAVPHVKSAGRVHNPIDAFILKRLEAKHLQPSETASRRELIRRVTYDLIGLPPTPEEVAAFLADRSPDAYGKLVDRLLASPHYGEKWGRHWLDLVRYAETNSYERDNPKPDVYKYRDYVIRAFNEDMPYDRFVREQLAGDEMPNASDGTVIATGYYRLGIWDDEPADPKQAQADDFDDLVTTTGQTFLGLTFDCARCHDHKFDPIPQKDYYRLVSFFRNINRFQNGGPTDEAVCFTTPQEKQEYEQKTAEIEAKRKANADQLVAMDAEYRKQRGHLVNPADVADLKYRYYEGSWGKIPAFDTLTPVATGTLNPALVDIRPRKRDESFGFVFDGVLNVPKEGDYTFYMDSDDGSRLTVGGKKVLEKDTDGGQGMEMHGAIHLAAGKVPFRIDYFQGSSAFGLSVAWGGPGFVRRPLSTLESCDAMGLPTLVSAELPLVLTPDKAARYAQLMKEKTELGAKLPDVAKVLCVTEASAAAPDTFLLKRGDPNNPGDKVEPAFPVCLGGQTAVVAPRPAGAKTTGRRTALANWLTSPDNSLPARVIVNRIWQYHFGRGIVRTPNDFGLQGTRPTHPELLDWLAKEFIAQGWSIKKLSRMILTSNAYKQASRPNPAGLKADPQNDLFWRFDMRRLDAEELRDSMLAVAGNLNLTMFGESIYPIVPKEMFASQAKPGDDWHMDKMKPEDLNRRSIYIHVKRGLIYPMLASFDVAETDRTTPTRFASTQPTQALGMMNGPFANAQAAVLADRVRKEAGKEPKAFSRRLLSLVTQRTPTDKEVAECVALMARLTKKGATPEQAQTYLSLMALNLDEFMYLD